MALETLDRQLRYFLTIAELGSLSKASDQLDQTQSGLSKQLAALEAHLGHALFTRTGRGVQLTPVGARLFDALKPAFRDIDRAVEAARDPGTTQGTLRLATVHTLSYYFTADVVARFISALPDANLSLLGRSSPEVVALVASGKADVGFVYDTAVDTDVVASVPLFEDEMALIVRSDSTLSGPQDLARVPLRLVGFPSHYALRRMLHTAGLEATFAAEAETIDAMLRLVESGIGHCILPSRIPERLLTDHGLRQIAITAPNLRRRVVAITPSQRTPSPLAAELMRCAAAVAVALRGDRAE